MYACMHACLQAGVLKYHVLTFSPTLPLGGSRHFALAEKGASELSGLLWCLSRVSLCTNYFRVVWCAFCTSVLSLKAPRNFGEKTWH